MNEISPDSLIRRASKDDITSLTDMCRRAFPDSFRWALPRVGTLYWRSAVNVAGDSGAETWVIHDKGHLSGVIVIIADEAKWSTCSKHRTPTYFDLIMSMFYSYRLFKPLGKRLSKARRTRAPTYSHTSEPNSRTVCPPGNRLAIELTAVEPSTQGSGIGSRLRRFAEERAVAHGRACIRTLTEQNNTRMRSLCERMGYHLVEIRNGQCVYVKHISNPSH